MWRMLGHISIAVSAVVALALVPAVGAAAADPPDTCQKGWLCGWSEGDFKGVEADFDWTPCQNSPFPLRSVSNTVGRGLPVVMWVHSGPDCTGEFLGSVASEETLHFLSKPGLSVSVAI